jgi:hypothetical protein
MIAVGDLIGSVLPAEASPIRLAPVLLFVPVLAIAIACEDVSGPPSGPGLPARPAGEVDSPLAPGARAIAPTNHLGPSKVEIVPAVGTNFANIVPFGNNVVFGYTGFVYRNVPAFALEVGDVVAFDLWVPNSAAVRRNIFFATANKNPAACEFNPFTLDVTSQGVAASAGWTMVVSENQVPQDPSGGDGVSGNFELRYVAEAPFVFPGGGLMVGFQGSPPATFADATIDNGADGFLVGTDCNDPGGQFYVRFLFAPDLTTDVIDTGDISDGTVIGGIVIFGEGGGASTCAEGVTEARSRVAQLFAGRPILRFVLNLLLTRMQGGAFPNAEMNFGRLLDFAAQQGIISTQEAAQLKGLVSPC